MIRIFKTEDGAMHEKEEMHLRHTTCHTGSLIRLLQRMCHIQNYRKT